MFHLGNDYLGWFLLLDGSLMGLVFAALLWVVRKLQVIAILQYEHNMMWADYAQDHHVPADAFRKRVAAVGAVK